MKFLELLSRLALAHERAHNAWVRASWRPGSETSKKDLERYNKREAEFTSSYNTLLALLDAPDEDKEVEISALARLLDREAFDDPAPIPSMVIIRRCHLANEAARQILQAGYRKVL